MNWRGRISVEQFCGEFAAAPPESSAPKNCSSEVRPRDSLHHVPSAGDTLAARSHPAASKTDRRRVVKVGEVWGLKRNREDELLQRDAEFNLQRASADAAAAEEAFSKALYAQVNALGGNYKLANSLMTAHEAREARREQARFAVASLAEASARYAEERDLSGLGASRFPPGTVRTLEGERLRVSYNGRVWRGEELVFDPA